MRRIQGPLGIALAVIAVIAVGGAVWLLRRNEKRLEERAEQAMKTEKPA